MKANYVAFIQDVLISIHANMRELKERRSFAAPEELTHIEAKLLAYAEILSILRTSAEEFHIESGEVGL